MGNLLVTVGSNTSIGIQQQITAGAQFTGALPVVAGATKAKCLTKFAPGTVGGLFDFEAAQSIVVNAVRASFGTSIAHTLSIVNLDPVTRAPLAGEEVVVYKGTADYLHLTVRTLLLPNQALKLVTTGATVAMIAQAVAMTEISFPG